MPDRLRKVRPWRRLRAFEWVFLAFFGYATLIALFFRPNSDLVVRTILVAVGVTAFFALLSRLGQTNRAIPVAIFREWAAVPLTYLAFREIGWFATPRYNMRLEQKWMRFDELVLNNWHGYHVVQIFGPLIPSYLELCYLLVYGVAAYGLALIYVTRFGEQRREQAGAFLTLYLVGTLSAYSLFPYFPSEPPRFAFPDLFPPMQTPLHAVNVRLLAAGTIHLGVFPSAHVSSVMSAAWALFWLFPERRRYAWVAFAYALSVAIATIYGRYHYTADVLAGTLVSLIPAALTFRRQNAAAAASATA